MALEDGIKIILVLVLVLVKIDILCSVSYYTCVITQQGTCTTTCALYVQIINLFLGFTMIANKLLKFYTVSV